MKWFDIKKDGLPRTGQYLVTIKSTLNGAVLNRITTVADFRTRLNLFCVDDGKNYSWTWSDDCGENVWAHCFHEWEHDGDVYTEEITAWAYMPEPYEEE